MYCQCRPNPDEELRKIEREVAQQSDPTTQRRLLLLRARAGDQGAEVELGLHSLAEALDIWANSDGRSVLLGEQVHQFPLEHPVKRHYFKISQVSTPTSPSLLESCGPNCYELRWQAHIFIDEEELEELQEQIQDIRLLRPINELEVRTLLRTTPDGVVVEYVDCLWHPELIRAGASWHSGWHEYRRPIHSAHPIRQVATIIENHILQGQEKGSHILPLQLWRQSGSPDSKIDRH